jgi:hypothetical protein
MVGSDVFHAHEFGHALQYILDLEDVNGDYDKYLENYFDTVSAESSRYWELEADAMAAYALAHQRGRNFPMSLLLEATQSAYSIGDCSYRSDDHHGSPKQRECATKWGADEGLDTSTITGSPPLTPREFRNLFLQNYEMILALNSSVCILTEDRNDNSSGNGNDTGTPVSSPIGTRSDTLTPSFPPPVVSELLTTGRPVSPLSSSAAATNASYLSQRTCTLTLISVLLLWQTSGVLVP